MNTEGSTAISTYLKFSKMHFSESFLPVVNTVFRIWSSLLAPFSRSQTKGCSHEPWHFRSCQSLCSLPHWLSVGQGQVGLRQHVLQRDQHHIIALVGFPQQPWCRSFSQSQWLLPLLLSDSQIDATFSVCISSAAYQSPLDPEVGLGSSWHYPVKIICLLGLICLLQSSCAPTMRTHWQIEGKLTVKLVKLQLSDGPSRNNHDPLYWKTNTSNFSESLS